MNKEVTYYIYDDDYYRRYYSLSIFAIVKQRLMEEYGKVEDVEVKEIERQIFRDKVKVSFKDLPDNGCYIFDEIKAEDGAKAIEEIKKAAPNAQDITIWTYANSFLPAMKNFLVSYYIVTNNQSS
jgi:hypothetical protein